MLSRLQRAILSVDSTMLTAAGEPPGFFGRVILYIGAGFYEEMLFRLLLLPATASVVRTFRVPRDRSYILAAVITSLIFSACHYVGVHGDSFAVQSFVFRFMAGLFFAG